MAIFGGEIEKIGKLLYCGPYWVGQTVVSEHSQMTNEMYKILIHSTKCIM